MYARDAKETLLLRSLPETRDEYERTRKKKGECEEVNKLIKKKKEKDKESGRDIRGRYARLVSHRRISVSTIRFSLFFFSFFVTCLSFNYVYNIKRYSHAR